MKNRKNRTYCFSLLAIVVLAFSATRISAVGPLKMDAAVLMPAGSECDSVVSGDFNGDGKLDLAITATSVSVQVLIGDGTGRLTGGSLRGRRLRGGDGRHETGAHECAGHGERKAAGHRDKLTLRVTVRPARTWTVR